MKIIQLADMLNQSDGVASYLFYLSKGLRDAGVKTLIYCGGGNAIEKFRKEEIEVISNRDFCHENRSVMNFASSVKKIIKLVGNTGANILHSHNHYAANISYYVSRLAGIKTVQTIHGLIPEAGFLNHYKANKFISVNENARDYMLKKRIACEGDIRLIRAGIPFENNINKKANPLIQVICASRLSSEKGIDVFISAVSKININTRNKAEFFIAGTGPVEEDLKQFNEKVKSNITFLGEVKDMMKLFNKAEITVYPTRCRTEGFPMAIIEAASAKSLVITSEFDSLKNIFRENIDGLVFQTGNADELSLKLSAAINNFDRYRTMASAFHENSKRHFNIRTCVEKHLQLYNECVVK